MEKFGLKTTLYDLLGYILSGSVLVIGLYTCYYKINIFRIEYLLQIQVNIATASISIGIFYITGYLLAALGSVIFENKLISIFFHSLYDTDMSIYNKRANELFQMDYLSCGKRTPSSYCQHNCPAIYETAFSFLTIYGVSRNTATALLILLFVAIAKNFYSWLQILIHISVIVILIHNFLLLLSRVSRIQESEVRIKEKRLLLRGR